MPAVYSENLKVKSCDDSHEIFNIKVDRDILKTIQKKFPNWFCKKSKYILNMDQQIQKVAPSSSKDMYKSDKTLSPEGIVDCSKIEMDKNRESLKVKLQLRRSINQLAEQNILPPLKTSPAIHEQRKLLERAKTGDLLKAKIQQRPNRQELERRHILDDFSGHVDPSLAEKYRMLEKAILVDQLNSKISHRPGPLELIEKNILHTNEPIEKIVKEGLLPFKVGSEDEAVDKNFLSFEDDSQSSEGDLFQANLAQSRPEIVVKQEVEEKRPNEIEPPKPIFETLPTTSTANIINISLVPSTSNLLAASATPISVGTFKIVNAPTEKSEITAINIPKPPPPPKLELISSLTYQFKPVKGLINAQNFLPIQITEAPTLLTTTPSQILPVQTHTPTVVNQHVSSFIQNNQNQKYSAPGKDKNRKKNKNKVVSKRTIKFHEYKGPTNKSSSSSTVTSTSTSANAKKVGETNFDLIMQQQCLLEYLENIYKNPNAKSESESQKSYAKQIKIENNSDISEDSEKASKIFNKPHVTIFPSKPQTSTSSIQSEISKDSTVTDVAKLSKMKVSELKAYLKRINLPVSGPKPLLIERLKPYLPLKPLDNYDDCSDSVSMSDGNDFYNIHSVSSTETESEMDGNDVNIVSSSSKEDDIVLEQQRKIEELQRKLQESQQELEQIKQIKQVDTNIPNVVFDSQEIQRYQLPTVFVVDVQPPKVEAQPITPAVILDSTPTSTSSLAHLHTNKVPPEMIDVSLRDDEPTSSNEVAKEATLPMSQEQEISDVLEILLKNGEWPEMSEGNYNQISSESDNNFIENVLAGQVLSPMLQEEESIDKILDTVDNQSAFPSSFNEENPNEFMEVDDSLLLSNADFNRNFSPSDFIEKSTKDINNDSFDINNLNVDNCDTKTKYNQYLNSLKSSQEECKPQKNRNGLIGNFENGIFDSIKNNNHNHNGNELFLISQDSKFVKDDTKNLQLSHNFDTLFNSEQQMDWNNYSSEMVSNDLFNNTTLFHDDGMDLF